MANSKVPSNETINMSFDLSNFAKVLSDKLFEFENEENADVVCSLVRQIRLIAERLDAATFEELVC